MKQTSILTAASLAALIGAVGLTRNVAAQDQSHGSQGDVMQGMEHGSATGPEQAESGAGHNGHGTTAPAMPGSPATEAYRAANLAMHAAMDIEFSDNADIDFARGMIGHHQGAIDMARIMLEHGEDSELRRLAEEVIEAQEAEIAFLQDWIAEHAD
ncbi:DUF305 domain-containing protein [uncultured Jannaschia sp.]|uniref:CopM family metallochaperone n=1 Tax=uncultured Jannaschia sp. TaxID=293347 RepID=UPI0026301683|nr:DUF305 domain-containing protein [uncultured Jannaschia sp.]